ncbi:hypothetical protein B1A85_12400 [Chroococcidiopsis sp. TS-821]|nr:hypothetical protein B1A85_12400 [Chroococcidiopsis sp. TS-821]
MLLILGFVRISWHKLSSKRITMNRKQQAAKQAAEAHRMNIQRSLQHRLEVAKAQGNEQLIRQLEAEINYFN